MVTEAIKRAWCLPSGLPDYVIVGIGRHSITSTPSPGKIAKLG